MHKPSASQPQMCSPEDAGPLGFLGGIGQTIGDLGRGLEYSEDDEEDKDE